MSKCKVCNGKGYLEFEHGLIQVACDKCKGMGEVNDKRQLSEETKQKIRESMKGNKNKKNGKHNRNDR